MVDPPGEARQDWELIQELAQRVGLNWAYKDVVRGVRRDGAVMPSLANITWERLVREDAVTYPCDAPDKPGNEIIFAHLVPDQVGPRQDRAGRPAAARRAARQRTIRWC